MSWTLLTAFLFCLFTLSSQQVVPVTFIEAVPSLSSEKLPTSSQVSINIGDLSLILSININPSKVYNIEVGSSEKIVDGSVENQISFSQVVLQGYVLENGQENLDTKVRLVLKSQNPVVFRGFILYGGIFYNIQAESNLLGQWTHSMASIESISIFTKTSRKRNLIQGQKQTFKIGVFIDCNYLTKFNGSYEDAVDDINNAIDFANLNLEPSVNIYLTLLDTSIYATPLCGDGFTFYPPCSTGQTIVSALSEFSKWRGLQTTKDEAIWIFLTTCYQLIPEETVDVGLGWQSSVCNRTAIFENGNFQSGTMVVSRLVRDAAYYLNFARQIGKSLGALPDDSPSLSCYAGSEPYIMSSEIKDNAGLNTTFSNCSISQISTFIDTHPNQIGSCIFNYMRSIVLSIEPEIIGVGSNVDLFIELEDYSYYGSQTLIGFSNSSQCINVKSLTKLTSNHVSLSSPMISEGLYFVCFSNDNGTTFHSQFRLKQNFADAKSNSISSITPDCILISEQPSIQITGLKMTPTTKIGFSLTDCTNPIAVSSYTNSTTMILSEPILVTGKYYLCYSLDGFSFIKQDNPNSNLWIVDGSNSNSVGSLTPQSILVNITSTLQTSNKVSVQNAFIAFSLSSCSDNLVGVSSVTNFTFTLGSRVSTPGNYLVCFSVDGGKTYIAQSFTFGFAVRPSPPRNLTLISAGADSFALSWNPPESNGFSSISSYSLFIQPPNAAVIRVETNILTHNISLLTAQTTYTIYVRANSQVATSFDSNILQATTGNPEPPSQVSNMTFTSTPMTASLSWAPPSYLGGLPILFYTIKISGKVEKSDQVSTRSYNIAGLIPNSNYSVEISASNSFAKGASATFTFTSGYATVSTPPKFLEAYEIGAKSVKVKWVEPDSNNNATIIGYSVEYRKTAETEFKSVEVDLINFVEITGLTSKTEYVIRVKAKNLVGSSESSNELQITTLKDLKGNATNWIKENLGAFIGILVSVVLLIVILSVGTVLLCRIRIRKEGKQKNLQPATLMYELED